MIQSFQIANNIIEQNLWNKAPTYAYKHFSELSTLNHSKHKLDSEITTFNKLSKDNIKKNDEIFHHAHFINL